MAEFKLKSKFKPDGDQPRAIRQLVAGLKQGHDHQTLLGVTCSGKTFTMANVIAAYQRPTLVIVHNKTLAAQLAQEYRDFFPEHAVHYFVSYYDYYQPEAYLPATDTYIEKDAKINQEIDRLRHASTQALLTRDDLIIVASVSCVYGLGSPADYEAEHLKLAIGQVLTRGELIKKLVAIHYERTPSDLARGGQFRAIGDSIEILTPSEKEIYNVILKDDSVAEIKKLDAVSRVILDEPSNIFVFPAKHFVTSVEDRRRAIKAIRKELKERLDYFAKAGLPLEAERLKRRTTYDLAMLEEVGYCNGIENYSRHLSGRAAGAAPDTLLAYFKNNFLTIIDESHVTIPQIAGMYAGDESRKKTLVEHGFRLPSALDNRPLKFGEFNERVGPIIYTSATPSKYELEHSQQIVEQIIRPTGLVDPKIELRPIAAKKAVEVRLPHTRRSLTSTSYPGQVKDFIVEAKKDIEQGGRVLATTLTKKMAEDLADYLKGENIKAEYLHSEIKTLERIKILTEFRKGAFDVLVGVNLLREGLDLPEVSLIGILDADKEGFLRSETSLVQTIGRAARNVAGRVILYADGLTGSMKKAIRETDRRRKIQLAYNKKHGITPQTIIKKISDITDSLMSERERAVAELVAIDRQAFDLTGAKAAKNLKKLLKEKNKQMSHAVKELDFETAAILRDEIKVLTG